jgi:hypothetical protein
MSEHREATESPEPPTKPCRNCGAPLEGEYCSHCGQREGRGDLHFSEAIGELADDVVAWDSRLWRTLWPLVFKPGYLTAEFIAGRKARYVAPFRLYLIISFVLFLVISASDHTISVGREDSSGEVLVAPIEIGDPNAVTTADVSSGTDREIDLADENSPQWLQDLDQRLEDNASTIQQEPGDFLDKILERLPQTMFFMLPLFALLLRLCYLFSPFHYLQHLVFALHYHSFFYLLYLIATIIELLGWHAGDIIFLLFLIYLPLALRRAYSSGTGGAIGKSLFIYPSYAIMLLMGFAAVLLLTLLLM